MDVECSFPRSISIDITPVCRPSVNRDSYPIAQKTILRTNALFLGKRRVVAAIPWGWSRKIVRTRVTSWSPAASDGFGAAFPDRAGRTSQLARLHTQTSPRHTAGNRKALSDRVCRQSPFYCHPSRSRGAAKSLPGLKRSWGSRAALICRMSASLPGSAVASSGPMRFDPTPCSAENEPPRKAMSR